MKRSNLEKIDLELYEETLDNGLKVYIVPKDSVNGIYATLNTRFGSTNIEFEEANKMIKVPYGVAHFFRTQNV